MGGAEVKDKDGKEIRERSCRFICIKERIDVEVAICVPH